METTRGDDVPAADGAFPYTVSTATMPPAAAEAGNAAGWAEWWNK
eukprot:gene51853-10081_t